MAACLSLFTEMFQTFSTEICGSRTVSGLNPSRRTVSGHAVGHVLASLAVVAHTGS